MLAKFLRLFGFDLDGQMQALRGQAEYEIQVLKGKAEDYAFETAEKVKWEAKKLGFIIAFAIGGAVMMLGTGVIALMALYSVVADKYGPMVGLGVIGLVTGLGAAVMFTLAAARSEKAAPRFKAPPRSAPAKPAASMPPPAVPRPDPVRFSPPPTASQPASSPLGFPLAFGDLRRPLTGAVEEFLSRSPGTGTPVDPLIAQVLQEARSASGQTISMAEDMIRTGSRKTVFGVLAGSLVIGWCLARKGGSPFSIEGLVASNRDTTRTP